MFHQCKINMKYDEAVEWIKGKRSMINEVPQNPIKTWALRIAETDAAMVYQAYWILKAYKEGLIKED